MTQTSIPPEIASMLATVLGEDLRSAADVRRALLVRVLSLPNGLMYGRGPKVEQYKASTDPFEQASAGNPAMLSVIRSHFEGNAAAMRQARDQSTRMVNPGNFPGTTQEKLEPATKRRLLQALSIYPFNEAALLAVTQIFWLTGQPLAAVRVAASGMAVLPTNLQARNVAALCAADLDWHEEAVRLLAPVFVECSTGGIGPAALVTVMRNLGDQLCAWLQQHMDAGREGLVGHLYDDDGTVMLGPFPQLDIALSLVAANASRFKPEQQQDDLKWVRDTTQRVRDLKARAIATGRLAAEA